MKKTIPTDARKTAAPAGPKQTTLRRTFIMTNRNGLHARPCALLIKALNKFHCDVSVEHDGETANGHSILGLMCLAVGCESKMTFTMTGDDAPQAMAAVQRLFKTHFEEAYVPGNKLEVA
ncbi:MAG: HPr family phosphocarrier protein [Verrucomicrobia bacterium]|nr:HPr family phosphocarrier protein [Verrucomicrobiota bacterium]